jgi:hypothetical protein
MFDWLRGFVAPSTRGMPLEVLFHEMSCPLALFLFPLVYSDDSARELYPRFDVSRLLSQ